MRIVIVGLSLLLALSTTVHAADVPADRSSLVKGNTKFALDLYQQLRTADGNLFLSPYSISSALAMTYAGARETTAEEMAKTLHFDLANDKLHPAFSELTKEINGASNPKRGYQLSVANALWGQKGFAFKPNFLKLNKDNYGAGLTEMDFAGASEASRKTINAWVEKETKDKIKDLIPEGVLGSDTRLVLTNAIYFKGDWASQFKKDRTREEDFNVSATKKVKTPLMHQGGDYKYLDGGTFQALELPYVGDEVTMVVLLPKKVDGLGNLEKSLTPDSLSTWIGKLRKQEVHITLPKFKITAEYQMNKSLQALGMKAAFGAGADLSGIGGSKGDLLISDVIHKAYVDVNEEGTEAAAATGVIIRPTAVRIVPDFRADRPFLFLIRDARSSSILFMGRLAEPK